MTEGVTEPRDKLDLSDQEYLEWISGWLDRADEWHEQKGTSPVFAGRLHIRRLYTLATEKAL